MKKLILGILGLMLMTSFVLADTHYVGDDSFNLPQISVQGSYLNDATHHTYFACAYSLDDDSGYEVMSASDSCRVSEQMFNPDSVGEHNYTLAIAFASREWNPVTREWETTETGTDNSLNYEFSVEEYPIAEDDFDVSFWAGFFDGIQNWFCEHTGFFCPVEPQETGWVYQEDADSYYSDYDGWYKAYNTTTGTYYSTLDYFYDGDWETSTFPSSPPYSGYVYINYTKISGAGDNSLWKVGELDYDGITHIENNVSIDEDCFSQPILQFRVYSEEDPNQLKEWDCWNGSIWKNLRTLDGSSTLTEEAMWWDIH